MASKRAIGEIFNIGGRNEISISNLAKMIKSLTSSFSRINYVPYEKAYNSEFDDMLRRKPSLSKANDFIGFNPRVKLEEIIARIIYEHKVN